MTPFLILSVQTGADAEYPDPTGRPVLHHFTEVKVTFYDGFDWEKHSKELLRRMRKATELNDSTETL